MAEYTPTTAEVMHTWCVLRGAPYHYTVVQDGAVGGPAAEFDRWLAAHDAQVKAEALREAARMLWDNNPHAAGFLEGRAARLAGGDDR